MARCRNLVLFIIQFIKVSLDAYSYISQLKGPFISLPEYSLAIWRVLFASHSFNSELCYQQCNYSTIVQRIQNTIIESDIILLLYVKFYYIVLMIWKKIKKRWDWVSSPTCLLPCFRCLVLFDLVLPMASSVSIVC